MFNNFISTLTNGFKAEFIFLLSFIAICFGISIIITKNPILSVLFLIGLFATISIYLMSLGLTFLGLSYLLVYVGAISILFLFILMLINVRISELVTEGKNSVPLAIIAVLCFNNSVGDALPYHQKAYDMILYYQLYIYKYLAFVFGYVLYYDLNQLASIQTASQLTVNVKSKSWDSVLVESTHISSIGNILYTSLFIYLIITALILLLAMVGTIVITKKNVGIIPTRA